MKNQQFRKLLKKKPKNSGLTLLELLIGLIMSIFVTGALGFGLYQVLRITSEESSKISARNQATRAIEFISDEIRRARTIDGDLLADLDGDGAEDDNTAPNFTNSANDKIVVLALDIPDISDNVNLDADDDLLGSDKDKTTPERIVYYLKSSTGSDWQGPLVLYRWGPPLDSKGDYTEGAWDEEPLIDGIDDTVIANACNSLPGTTQAPALPADAKGFYACISGEKTAQLFLTSGIYADKGEADSNNPSQTYTADTKVAARAKVVSVDSSEDDEIPSTDFKTLKADYDCTAIDDPAAPGRQLLAIPWTIRLDFNTNDLSGIDLDASNPNNSYDSSQLAAYNDTTPWLHQPDRKSQPINVSTNNNVTITVSAVSDLENVACNSRGNYPADGTEQLSDYDASIDVNYTMKLNNASGNDADGKPNWHSFNGGSAKDKDGNPLYDNPNVNGDGTVLVLKEGSTITADLTPSGFTATENGVSTKGQQSIGEFLDKEGYAKDNNDGTYTIVKPGEHPDFLGDMTKGLASNQRILAFELGHTKKYLNDDPSQPNPGFDVNDAVFIMTNDKFDEEYATP